MNNMRLSFSSPPSVAAVCSLPAPRTGTLRWPCVLALLLKNLLEGERQLNTLRASLVTSATSVRPAASISSGAAYSVPDLRAVFTRIASSTSSGGRQPQHRSNPLLTVNAEDCFVSFHEYGCFLRLNGWVPRACDVFAVFRRHDRTSSGRLSYAEFVRAFLPSTAAMNGEFAWDPQRVDYFGAHLSQQLSAAPTTHPPSSSTPSQSQLLLAEERVVELLMKEIEIMSRINVLAAHLQHSSGFDLLASFQLLDWNNDGLVTVAEFAAAVTALSSADAVIEGGRTLVQLLRAFRSVFSSVAFDASDLAALFALIDRDRDGRISFYEWVC